MEGGPGETFLQKGFPRRREHLLTGRLPPPNGEIVGMTGYLAPAGFESELVSELGYLGAAVDTVREGLVLAWGEVFPVWAQNIWFEPREHRIDSIGHAVKILKGMQRNWALYSVCEHRRASLIQEQLPKVSARPLVFGEPPPSSPLGSWTLLDRDRLLASPRCQSPFPNGIPRFVEDKSGPPNRAYLKLWEFFTRYGQRPGPGDLCYDLGSSPGGWTWVLARLGARVVSVDKAGLHPSVSKLPGVEHRLESAFAQDPAKAGPVDWLFSDVICYPGRLLSMIERWLEHGDCKRFVCTVKLQGETDLDLIGRFMAIPGSGLTHLYNNKHELTWFKL